MGVGKLDLTKEHTMNRTPTKTAAEIDVTSRTGRKAHCYLKRAGVTASIKNQINRRERRNGKAEARTWM